MLSGRTSKAAVPARTPPRSTLTRLLAALVPLLLLGCAHIDPPDEPAHIEGFVTTVSRSGLMMRVMVEEEPGPWEVTGGRKLQLATRPWTPVFVRQSDGSSRPATIRSLRRGARVQAWHRGFVMESHPGQAGARAYVVLELAP